VYFEATTNSIAAIAREKEIKAWRRQKKEQLIATVNPTWDDLAADWFD
jgi:putative endonuclease